MVTLHPTHKQTREGYVPMINLCNEQGQLIGAHVPKGGYREFNTFASVGECEEVARMIAYRCAAKRPDLICVA